VEDVVVVDVEDMVVVVGGGAWHWTDPFHTHRRPRWARRRPRCQLGRRSRRGGWCCRGRRRSRRRRRRGRCGRSSGRRRLRSRLRVLRRWRSNGIGTWRRRGRHVRHEQRHQRRREAGDDASTPAARTAVARTNSRRRLARKPRAPLGVRSCCDLTSSPHSDRRVRARLTMAQLVALTSSQSMTRSSRSLTSPSLRWRQPAAHRR
jgi:hypothetical protein